MPDRKPMAIELGYAETGSPFGTVLELFIPGDTPLRDLCPYCVAHDVGLAWWRFLGGHRRFTGADLHLMFGEHTREHRTGRIAPARAALLDALLETGRHQEPSR